MSYIGQIYFNQLQTACKVTEEAPSLEVRISDAVVRAAKEIAGDFQRRKEGYLRDPLLLEGGCWYPNEYFTALVRSNKVDRLTELKMQGAFYHCYPNFEKTGFQLIDDPMYPSGKVPGCFRLSSQCPSAAKALRSLENTFVLIDCEQFCQLAQYKALLEILGEGRFDKLFSSENGIPLLIGSYARAIETNPLGVFTSCYRVPLTPSINDSAIAIGQIVSFKNHETYGIKHINGEGQSLNTICTDNTRGAKKFIALGTPAEGVSEEHVYRELLNEYNKDPVDFSIYTSELAYRILATYQPETLTQFKSLRNHKVTVQEFNGHHSEVSAVLNPEVVRIALEMHPSQLSMKNLIARVQRRRSS